MCLCVYTTLVLISAYSYTYKYVYPFNYYDYAMCLNTVQGPHVPFFIYKARAPKGAPNPDKRPVIAPNGSIFFHVKVL